MLLNFILKCHKLHFSIVNLHFDTLLPNIAALGVEKSTFKVGNLFRNSKLIGPNAICLIECISSNISHINIDCVSLFLSIIN